MDLLQTVRKEGSRGGRDEFKWEDVKNDSQRENYLGHSLMAPVGRWQRGRDLNWYAKAGDTDKQTATEKLAEEKRLLKQAEEDAMLAAMGLPVPQRASNNANLTPLGEKASELNIKKAIEDAAADDDQKETVKGLGYRGYSGTAGTMARPERDVLEGYEPPRSEKRHQDSSDRKHSTRDGKVRDDRDRRRRHRSRSRSRERSHRHRASPSSRDTRRHDDHRRDRRRSRSRNHDRKDRRMSRSRTQDRLVRRRSRDGSRARGERDVGIRGDRKKDHDERMRSRSPYRERHRPRRSPSPYERHDSERRRWRRSPSP